MRTPTPTTTLAAPSDITDAEARGLYAALGLGLAAVIAAAPFAIARAALERLKARRTST